MAHVTPSDVVSFRARTLDRARVEAIGAHVRECGECTRLVFGDPGVIESVHSAWTPEPVPAPRRWMLAVAAVAAFIAVAIGVWISRDTPARRVTPPREPEITIIARMIRDGSVAITLDGQGAVKDVSSSRVEWNALAMNALQTGELPAAGHIELTRPGEVLRGNDPAAPRVKLLQPVGITIESDQPLFRWTRIAGARYCVLVARDGAIVAKSELQNDTEWQPPQPLSRGEVYAWQLAIVTGEREWTVPGPEDPPAQFHVLSAEAWRELEAARARNSHLVTGLVAARHGLHEIAVNELGSFAAANPGIANASRLAAAAKRNQLRPAPTTTNADQ